MRARVRVIGLGFRDSVRGEGEGEGEGESEA